jgi:hypothetical protein
LYELLDDDRSGIETCSDVEFLSLNRVVSDGGLSFCLYVNIVTQRDDLEQVFCVTLVETVILNLLGMNYSQRVPAMFLAAK